MLPRPGQIIIDPTLQTHQSAKAFSRRMAREPVKPLEVSRMPFLDWERIAQKLIALNKHIIFTTLPDSKIAIGLDVPPKSEITLWEDTKISGWEREKVKREMGHSGPRPFIVAASRGFVAPYTRIITAGSPPQVICRSLKEILTKLVGAEAFTWDQAERAFEMLFRGPGTDIQVKYVEVTPQVWGETKARIELSSDEPAAPAKAQEASA